MCGLAVSIVVYEHSVTHMLPAKQLVTLTVGILLLATGLPVSYLAWPARTPAPVKIDNAALQSLEQLQQHGGNQAMASWQGERWALVFFGLTHCADICPATLSRIAKVLDQLGDAAEYLQPIFITLDPQRDTPEQLAAYVSFFDERILGLVGTVEQTQRVANAWGVYSQRVPSNGGYLLDHSTTLYLLGPDGKLNRRFSGRMDSDSMAREIALLLRDRDQGSSR